MKKLYLSILFLFVSYTVTFAQLGEIGAFVGGSYYLGDINPANQFSQTQIAEGIFFRYNIDSRLALRFSAFRGELKSDDKVVKYNEERGLKFQTPVNELSLQFEFNFLKYYIGSSLNYWSPYIFGGISYFSFKPEADGYDLRDLGTEGQNTANGDKKYSLNSFSIPFGIGVKYSLSKRFGLGLEWGIRKTFTDYIDDISKTYYLEGENINTGVPEEYYSDPSRLNEVGMQRGNSKNNDWYSFAGISISYKINLSNCKGCRDFPK